MALVEQKPCALLCYARADEPSIAPFLSQFRQRLSDEIRLQTKEPFAIFQDTEDIRSGSYVSQTIEDDTSATTFFIPVITPAFYESGYCCDELHKFLHREEQLARNDVIIPLYYDETPQNALSLAVDDAIATILTTHRFVDWRPIHGQPFEAFDVQHTIDRIATHIYTVIQSVQVQVPEPQYTETVADTMSDEVFGTIFSSKPSIPPSSPHSPDTLLHEPLPPTDDSAPLPTASPLRSALEQHHILVPGILQHHAGIIVQSVAFNHNSTMMASGGRDTVVSVWDVATGELVHRLEGHTDYVESVAFSPTGHVLASASRDKTIRLWDIETGLELQTLQGHAFRVTYITFNPQGTIVASCSNDKSVRLWDVGKRTPARRIEGHTRRVTGVAFSPNGAAIATCGEDNTIRLWEVATGREIQRYNGHTDYVRSVTFSPDGVLLASGSDDTTVRLWDVASGRCVQTLSRHQAGVETVAFRPQEYVLVAGGRDSVLWMWELHIEQEDTNRVGNDTISACEILSERKLLHLFGERDYVRHVTFSPDGMLLAIHTDTPIIHICGFGMPEYSWKKLETTWIQGKRALRDSRKAAGLCVACGKKLTLWQRLTSGGVCASCRQ